MSRAAQGLGLGPRLRGGPTLLIGLVLLIVTSCPANAQGLASQLTHQLAQARHLDRVMSHWHLAEAQRLAALVPDGWSKLAKTSRRLARKARVPWLQGEALGSLAAATQRTDPNACRKHALAAGVIATGTIAGPLKGPGPTQSADPALTYDPTTRLPGKHGPVTWRPFQDALLFGPLQLADLIDAEGDTHALVVTAIEVADKTDAMLVFGSSGPLSVWLDGRSLFDWDGERPLRDWQHAHPVQLSPGVHHLVLRVGHRDRPPQIMARLVDRRGRLPRGVTLRPPRRGEATQTWSPSTALPPPLADLPTKGLKQRARLLLLTSGGSAHDSQAARALHEAIRSQPKDPELHYLLGRASHQDVNRAREAFARAMSLSESTHVEALGELLRLHRQEGQGQQALPLMRQLRDQAPKHPEALLFAATQLSEISDALATLAAFPGLRTATHPHVRSLFASLLEQASKPMQAATVWANIALDGGGHTGALRRAVRSARTSARAPEALPWVEDALQRRPWSVDLHLIKARLLATGLNATERALEVLVAAEQRHPNNPDILALRARLLMLDNNTAGALTALEQALEIRPQDRELADYRRSLINEHTLAADHAIALKLVLDESADTKTSMGAKYLLDKQVIRVQANGLSSRFRQQIIRIEGQDAAERFEQIPIYWTPDEERLEIIEAELIGADGARRRPLSIDTHYPRGKRNGVYTLTATRVIRFENLNAGDVLHIQTQHDAIGNRNLFGEFFGVFLPLQAEWAKARSEVHIIAPKERELYTEQRGVASPTRESQGDQQHLIWRQVNLDGLRVEPHMPGYGDIGSYINVSTYGSWDELARWYRELIRAQLRLSPDLNTLARELTRNLNTPLERVQAIHEWVLRHTRYVGIEFGIHGFKPYAVTQVVQRGYGDCKDKAALLVAMLDAVAIRAEFVLVRTRNLGRIASTPATLWAFNHAIAYVPIIDTYIDATSEFAGTGEVPALDQGAQILRLDLYNPAKPPTLTTLPYADSSTNRTHAKAHYIVNADGSGLVSIDETIAGSEAPRLRRELSDESRRDDLIATLLARRYPGARLEKAHYAGIDDLELPVRLQLTAALPQLAQRQGGNLVVPIHAAPSELLTQYASLSARTHDLILDFPWLEEAQDSYRLPSGSRVNATLPSVDIHHDVASYTRRMRETIDGFVIDERLEILTPRINAQDYRAFRRFLIEVSAARQAYVTVQIPTVDPTR